MKKTFRENVFICEDFSLNCTENELCRKYGIFGGSTEKNKDNPILEIEQNGWFHWIGWFPKQNGWFPKLHLPSKINFTKILEHRINLKKKMELCEFVLKK